MVRIKGSRPLSGDENYSMHFDGRTHGERPYCLLDFFCCSKTIPRKLKIPVFSDESHVTLPQVGGMYAGDQEMNLIEHGFGAVIVTETERVRV